MKFNDDVEDITHVIPSFDTRVNKRHAIPLFDTRVNQRHMWYPCLTHVLTSDTRVNQWHMRYPHLTHEPATHAIPSFDTWVNQCPTRYPRSTCPLTRTRPPCPLRWHDSPDCDLGAGAQPEPTLETVWPHSRPRMLRAAQRQKDLHGTGTNLRYSYVPTFTYLLFLHLLIRYYSYLLTYYCCLWYTYLLRILSVYSLLVLLFTAGVFDFQWKFLKI